ncbi:MAG: carbon-nitrogen hydrolase family protein, partial [Thermoplasmata archaeon]
MRVLLGELAPRRGSPSENFGRLGELLEGRSVDLAVFPELFATGYALGDRVHRLALGPEDPARAGLGALSRSSRIAIVLGAPLVSPDRPGEVENAALAFDPDGTEGRQAKRYLPAFGPFEEGQFFSPGARSRPLLLAGHSVGLAVCYDAFFPEVFRELALAGAELLVIISASPVTSRRLFEKVLPA